MQIINTTCSKNLRKQTWITLPRKIFIKKPYIHFRDKGFYVEFLKEQFGNAMFIFKFLYDEVWSGKIRNFFFFLIIFFLQDNTLIIQVFTPWIITNQLLPINQHLYQMIWIITVIIQFPMILRVSSI